VTLKNKQSEIDGDIEKYGYVDALVDSSSLPDLTINNYSLDPVWQKVLECIENPFLDQDDFDFIKNYIEKPGENHTCFTLKQVAYIHNHLRILRSIFRKPFACQIWLQTKRTTNVNILSKRCKHSRTTVQHWIKKLLECQLIQKSNLGEGNVIPFLRNRKDKFITPFFGLLDLASDDCIKRKILEETESSLNGLLDGPS